METVPVEAVLQRVAGSLRPVMLAPHNNPLSLPVPLFVAMLSIPHHIPWRAVNLRPYLPTTHSPLHTRVPTNMSTCSYTNIHAGLRGHWWCSTSRAT